MKNKKTYNVGCRHNIQREFIYPIAPVIIDKAGKKRKVRLLAKFDSSMSIILKCPHGCTDIIIHLDKCKR